MRLISQKRPAPRLLTTVASELRDSKAEDVRMKSRLKGASLFSGNGRAIFTGIVVGAALLSTISIVYVRRHAAAGRGPKAERPSEPVSIQSVSRPEPIVVKISPDLIRVSAISMGQPRMAIINGRLVGEGEEITLQVPPASVAVSLRVAKIADGQIQLTDGMQTITARLEIPPARKAKP